MVTAPLPPVPRTFEVVSTDGTRVRGWAGGGEGPALLLSNGLGTVPSAWPSLTSPDCPYDVVSWYHRGTFGTERPADRRRVTVEDHVDDAVAVMDARGVGRAVVACWSIGVNVGFELARRHPDRVAGLLAVAGVPGGTFATMGGPLRVPRRWRHPVASATARTGPLVGPVLNRLLPRVPVDRRTAWLLAHSGFMLPGADPDALVPMLQEFVRQDWRWYARLAVGASRHAPMDLAEVTCPVAFVAGRHDVLTSVHDVVEVAAAVPHATVTVLPGSHFLPMEHPALVARALADLVARTP